MSIEQQARSSKERQTISLKGHQFTVVADRPETSKFWQSVDAGWEDDTLNFIQNNVGADTTFVDVGAWIGPISLLASRLGKRVLALEPDPVAHGDLLENISINRANIEVLHVGIDNSEGTLTLYAPTGLGNSITSSFARPDAAAIKVPTITFQHIASRIAGATNVVVKVDIEGHEYNILGSLARFVVEMKAPLHLSVHPRSFYDNVRLQKSLFGAKADTWRATLSLVEKLRSIGTVINPKSGRAFSTVDLARLVFFRRRAKNFSVEVFPSAVSLG